MGWIEEDGFIIDDSPWVEAEVIAEPVKKVEEPRVLIRRRTPELVGPDGEDIVFFPGFPVISLFTGIGGFDIGVEQAGFTCVVQHEWDTQCCQTLIHNRPSFFRHAALIQGDIRNTPTSMILEEGGLFCGEAYMVIGGPPCQGFSTSNTGRHTGDQRNDLVFEFLRVVREARPRYFAFENVPGFTNLNKGSYMKAFLEAAYGSYYEIVYGLVDCSEYAIPQHRVRFICMGTRRDIAEISGTLAALPEPETFSKGDLKKLKVYQKSPLFYHEQEELLLMAPGIRYFPDREVLKPPSPTGNVVNGEGRSKAFFKFYDKLRKEEPDRIVEAQVPKIVKPSRFVTLRDVLS